MLRMFEWGFTIYYRTAFSTRILLVVHGVYLADCKGEFPDGTNSTNQFSGVSSDISSSFHYSRRALSYFCPYSIPPSVTNYLPSQIFPPRTYLAYFFTNANTSSVTSAGCDAFRKCWPSCTTSRRASGELVKSLISSCALATE